MEPADRGRRWPNNDRRLAASLAAFALSFMDREALSLEVEVTEAPPVSRPIFDASDGL